MKGLVHLVDTVGEPARDGYEVFLWLPDPDERIGDRPEYAIRLANAGTWDPASGYNSLGHIIEFGSDRSNTQSIHRYATDPAIILNPERGPFEPRHTGTTDYIPFDAESLRESRADESTSLIRWNVNIRQFRDTHVIARSYLDNLQSDLDTLRAQGFKTIIRAQYDIDGDTDNDVPFDRMSAHVEQLASVFNANKDVIASYEAGFVGRWGEWHGSTNYGSGWWPDTGWEPLAEILELIMSSFEDRPVMLRYPRHIRYMLNDGNPRISPEHIERLGLHNDAFLAAPDEWGTYSDENAPEERDFILDWVPGRAVNGEHEWDEDYGDEWRQERFHHFAEQHWSSIRAGFHTNVTDMWRATDHPTESGTYWDAILRRLGYRLQLVRASLPNSISPDAPLSMELVLVNTGWAAPYNRRTVFIVLRSTSTGEEHYLPLDTDVRTWTPEAGEITLNGTWHWGDRGP